METRFFPLFIDLSEKKILVAGGGTIAQRRVQSLLPFARNITVISPSVTETLEKKLNNPDAAAASDYFSAFGRVRDDSGDHSPVSGKGPVWLKRPFRDGDEAGMDLVLACTDDPILNRRITKRARALGIPANNCSDRDDCDFLFPGLSTRGSVTVGITAGGNDHRLVRRIREQTDALLEKMVPREDEHA